MRLGFLDYDHVKGPFHAVCDCASFCSRVPAENRVAHLLVQIAIAFGVPLKCPHTLHLLELRAWTTLRLRDYRRPPPSVGSRIFGGSGRPREALNGSVPPCSVSSDLHESAGVSHGCLSFSTIL